MDASKVGANLNSIPCQRKINCEENFTKKKKKKEEEIDRDKNYENFTPFFHRLISDFDKFFFEWNVIIATKKPVSTK